MLSRRATLSTSCLIEVDTYFTTDGVNPSAAEKIYISLMELMKKYGVGKTLLFIGGDSTNVNCGEAF